MRYPSGIRLDCSRSDSAADISLPRCQTSGVPDMHMTVAMCMQSGVRTEMSSYTTCSRVERHVPCPASPSPSALRLFIRQRCNWVLRCRNLCQHAVPAVNNCVRVLRPCAILRFASSCCLTCSGGATEARAAAWNRLGTELVVGYASGHVCRWDIKAQCTVCIQTVDCNAERVFTQHACPWSSCDTSSSRDTSDACRTLCIVVLHHVDRSMHVCLPCL
jgi:hypothetical protein